MPALPANKQLGCAHCREAVYSFGLLLSGVSMVAHLQVYRCPVCATYWLATERAIAPATD